MLVKIKQKTSNHKLQRDKIQLSFIIITMQWTTGRNTKEENFLLPGRKIQNVLTVGEEVVYLGGIKKQQTTIIKSRC